MPTNRITQMKWTVQFSHSVVSDSLRPYEPQHARPPCPSPTPGVHPNPWTNSHQNWLKKKQKISADHQQVKRLLLLQLSHFSRVRPCATPQMAAHQAPRPWVSPGKNTGVGCHFLLQCMKVEVKSESEVVQSCPTLGDPMDCSLPGSSCPRDFPAKSTDWSGQPLPSPKKTASVIKKKKKNLNIEKSRTRWFQQ